MKSLAAFISSIPLFLGLCILTGCDDQKNNSTGNLKEEVKEKKPEEKMATPASLQFCTEIPLVDSKRKGSQAGGIINAFWPIDHRKLSVVFLDGDSIVIHKVMNIAKEWEQHCGIRFNFNMPSNPDISISFKQAGSWSYVGKQSKNKKPSMNLGWLTPTTSDTEYHRVVLHEFGHALGLIHEHQNPSQNPIQWKEESVYAYYFGSPHYWSKEYIDRNIFTRYSVETLSNTDFDSSSIMLYAVPKELTQDGYFTNWNNVLSDNDKKFIGLIYPK